jgi:FemAB-related protein (PEP-CTERM system-associated)
MAETRVIHHIDGTLALEVRRFLAESPAEAGACHEHDPRWLDVLRDAMGHRTMAVVARDGSVAASRDGAVSGASGTSRGGVVGYLPLALVTSRLFGRFLVSLPYLNRAGIVAADRAVREELLEAARDLADRFKVQYLELRHHAHTLEHKTISHNRDEKLRMVLDLPGEPDGLWSGYSAKVRNQIRKGDKAGLSIRFGGAKLLDGFYDVFSTNMRDLGTPVYPRGLFASVIMQFNDSAELAVVMHSGRPVAGALLIHGRSCGAGSSQVPSASSLRDAKHTNANMWMYHKLLERAVVRGSASFDFGRSSPDSGTYRFKKQWGAVPFPTTWQYYLRYGDVGAVRPDNPKYQRRIAAWQRLPVWVTRLVGPRIVRGIP